MRGQDERLKEAREKAGYASMAEAVRAFGWTYSTYASHETGLRSLTLKMAERYARAFKVSTSWLLTGDGTSETESEMEVVPVPIAGEIAAGLWREVETDGEDYYHDPTCIAAIPDPRYPAKSQFALRVRGPSMNKVIDDGSYVIAVRYEYARRANDGDIVVLKRYRGGLVETTLKRFRANGQDGVSFVPESTDPRFQEPVVLAAEEEGTTVEIAGIALAQFKPLI